MLARARLNEKEAPDNGGGSDHCLQINTNEKGKANQTVKVKTQAFVLTTMRVTVPWHFLFQALDTICLHQNCGGDSMQSLEHLLPCYHQNLSQLTSSLLLNVKSQPSSTGTHHADQASTMCLPQGGHC